MRLLQAWKIRNSLISQRSVSVENFFTRKLLQIPPRQNVHPGWKNQVGAHTDDRNVKSLKMHLMAGLGEDSLEGDKRPNGDRRGR